MALANCARCKKIFGKIASPVCPKCQADEDADYTKIHHVIAKNPGMKAKEVAELAGVEVECVLRMLDEGRLRYTEVGEKPTCGRCGAQAISRAKRLCESCLAELDRECAAAMRELRKDMPRGVRAKGKASSGVLGEVRQDLEKKRKSPTLKRVDELEERAHPGKAAPTVAREAREKKGRKS